MNLWEKTLSVNKKAQFASYKVFYKIVCYEKPHIIGQYLSLPFATAIEIVETMFGDNINELIMSLDELML